MGEQDKRVKKMVVSVVVERRHRCPAAGFWRHIAAAWLWVRLTASRWVGLLVVGRGRRRMKWWWLLGLRRQPLEAAAGGTQGGKGEERERGKEEDV